MKGERGGSNNYNNRYILFSLHNSELHHQLNIRKLNLHGSITTLVLSPYNFNVQLNFLPFPTAINSKYPSRIGCVSVLTIKIF